MTMAGMKRRSREPMRDPPPWVGRLVVTLMCLGNLVLVAFAIRWWPDMPARATPGACLLIFFNGPVSIAGLYCVIFKPQMFE